VTALAPIVATAAFLQEQTMRIDTSPVGLSFTVDGTSHSGATTFWFEPGSYHAVSVPTLQSGAAGIRYAFAAWSDGGAAAHVVVFSGTMSLEASFRTEYYLTVTSSVPGEGGGGWYSAGSTPTATVTETVYIAGPGERLSFRGWGGDASGTGLTSYPILMDGPKVAIADYGTEFYLAVTTDYAKSSGSGWYAADALAVAAVNATVVSTGMGKRVVFAEWSSDASGTSASGSTPILMSGPRTATARWTTEYLVRVESDLGTVQGGGWYASGATATLRAPSQVASGGQTYAFTGWTGDVSSSEAVLTITVERPITVRATWASGGIAGAVSTTFALLMVLLAVVLLVAVVLWRRRRRGR
jgi:uncharacterized repeat protein (TIGR02543 family)